MFILIKKESSFGRAIGVCNRSLAILDNLFFVIGAPIILFFPHKREIFSPYRKVLRISASE